MKVTLVACTPNALDVLLTTKAARLDGKPVSEMTYDEKMVHWGYMKNTIKSSWEFCDYTFLIEGVTRAFTHQWVRNRTMSFAQQAQRAVDASDLDVIVPDALMEEGAEAGLEIYLNTAHTVKDAYSDMLEVGVARQDARAILPTNIETTIMCKANLRTLHDIAKVRLCTRSQGEMQQVFRQIRDLVHAEHPWTAGVLEAHCVATGTCAFPNWGPDGCQYYDPRMNLDALKAELFDKFWRIEVIQEAAPTARGGIAKEPEQWKEIDAEEATHGYVAQGGEHG